MSRDWQESEHPRVPGGVPGGHGGEFTDNPAGWVARVAGLLGRRTRQPGPSLEQLQAGLESGVKKTGKVMGGASQTAQRIDFNNGVVSVRKTLRTEDAHREYLGGLVGAAVGAPVPAVVLGDRTQVSFRDLHPDLAVGADSDIVMDYSDVWMGYVEGNVAARATPLQFVTVLHAPKTPNGRLLGLVDALAGNNDRNPGNWIMQSGGRGIAGVDMGASFAPSGMPGDATMFFRTNDFGTYLLVGGGRLASPDWADTNLSRSYLESLEPRLEALRPEFERLGHIDWYGEMMLRWAAIRGHATGDEVLS